MEKKPFNKVIEELDYVNVEDTTSKYADEVAEEIRGIIRSYGWNCLDECEDVDEWVEDNLPNIDGYECSAVSENEFLCKNKYRTEHDVDWVSFNIVFYGIWGEAGVFAVECC